MAIIKAKMYDLFSDGTDLEKKLYRTIREYNSFDKSKLSDLVEDTLKHFKLQTAVQTKVYTDLYEIIQADGNIDQSETKALEILKQIIDLHTEKNAP